jgi:KaiC/GvpD/RAD55 family RecA-like ATPase
MVSGGLQQAGVSPLPGMQPMPGMALPGMQPMPGMALPGMQPMPGMAAMNPMMQMMQMMQAMQMMMGGGLPQLAVDPAAMPFAAAAAPSAASDAGLDADIICPATLAHRVKTQQALPMGSVLDLLCLTEDGLYALGGVPKGCTMALAGPPGKGKTRTALAGLARMALTGEKVAFVIAEEGFHDTTDSGRDDLCSRMTKIGMAVTGLDEPALAQQVLKNVFVLESQYHKGHSWDDFIHKYRWLIEREGIRFVVIDSLNMLDPTKNRTADNLSALKTYNHSRGVTALCIGQIRDTGAPVGGEALQHTADAVFLIEEMSLGSKEIADIWGGKYRDVIDVIRVVKSVTTPIVPHPVRVGRDPLTGVLQVHANQPVIYPIPSIRE